MPADAYGLSVVKLGGSVLTGLPAYRASAAYLADQCLEDQNRKWLVVVSAQDGHTDALAREARAVAAQPDAAVLDLLWSTGELRSVSLLTLALMNAGVRATALNAYETGLRTGEGIEDISLSSIALRAALSGNSVVVVPGFLATKHQRLLTLGRGGSDLSAVLLATALDADECVLVKDVDGYFTADPATCPGARQISGLSFEQALTLADEGCPLVQRQALAAARRARIPLVVRSLEGSGTAVTDGHSRPVRPEHPQPITHALS